MIGEIERALNQAYEDARAHDLWRTITFVTPTRLSSLQWRRRLGRREGGVFNVRFIDLAQLALELRAKRGAPVTRTTRAVEIAAAWRTTKESTARYAALAAHPNIPARLLRAFDVVDSIENKDRERLSPDFLALETAFQTHLGGAETTTRGMRHGLETLHPNDLPPNCVFLTSASPNRLAHDLGAKLATGTPFIDLDVPAPRPIRGVELHDEQDEVAYALALVQDAACNGIPCHEIAIVVPTADPYAKLLDLQSHAMSLKWNGAPARSIGETLPGRVLRATSLPQNTWPEVVAKAKEAVGEAQDETAQLARDRLDEWLEIERLVPTPDPTLLEALRQEILDAPKPRTSGFGDGVFVGTPQQTVGLVFRRLILLGVTAGNYPRSPGAVPFLPPGVGIPSPDAQRHAFDAMLRRGEEITLLHARCDRRSAREAFPSPWIAEVANQPATEVRSSIELLQLTGPRSEEQTRTVAAIESQVVQREARALLAAWSAPDVTQEAGIVRSLFPDAPISPSQLETFFECPRKWFFRYVEQLKEPEEKPPFGLSPLDLGSIVHAALQSLFALRRTELNDPAYRWTPEDRNSLAADVRRLALQKQTGPAIKPVEAEIKRWVARLDRMLDWDQNERIDRGARPLATEFWLSSEIAGVQVSGKADRIDLWTDGTVNVIDYKTGKGTPATKAQKQDPTRGGTMLQGLIYADLACQNAGALGAEHAPSHQGAYWYLGRPIEKMSETQTLGEPERTRLEECVATAKEMMAEGLVPMRPSRSATNQLCGYCAYRSICPADREAIVLRQATQATGPFARFLNVVSSQDSSDEGAAS